MIDRGRNPDAANTSGIPINVHFSNTSVIDKYDRY